MNNVKAALQAALSEIGLQSLTPISISRDVGVLMGGVDNVVESNTYNAICMNRIDDHELLVGAVLGTRPFINGKNGARDLPPFVKSTVNGKEYTFWINTIEGVHMAAVKSVPFLSLGLEEIIYIDEHAAQYISSIRELVSTDKSSYLNQCLAALGNIMSLQTIDPLKICMSAWLIFQIKNFKQFKPMTSAEFLAIVDGEQTDDENLNTVIEAVKLARMNESIGMPQSPEEIPSATTMDRIAFATAVRTLTEGYVEAHVSVAQETSESEVIAAATKAEREACELVRKHMPKLTEAWKAFIE